LSAGLNDVVERWSGLNIRPRLIEELERGLKVDAPRYFHFRLCWHKSRWEASTSAVFCGVASDALKETLCQPTKSGVIRGCCLIERYLGRCCAGTVYQNGHTLRPAIDVDCSVVQTSKFWRPLAGTYPPVFEVKYLCKRKNGRSSKALGYVSFFPSSVLRGSPYGESFRR
jgi:hypothetical protein